MPRRIRKSTVLLLAALLLAVCVISTLLRVWRIPWNGRQFSDRELSVLVSSLVKDASGQRGAEVEGVANQISVYIAQGGVVTQAEMLAHFGPPDLFLLNRNGVQWWSYFYNKAAKHDGIWELEIDSKGRVIFSVSAMKAQRVHDHNIMQPYPATHPMVPANLAQWQAFVDRIRMVR